MTSGDIVGSPLGAGQQCRDRHLRQIDPALRVSNLRDWFTLHRPEDLATFADGLRRAGLPE